MTRTGLFRHFSQRELWLYALILVLALVTRFWLLGERVMSHDESLHTQFAYNLYRDGSFQHTPLMHGPVLFHATAFFYFLFGDSDFTARIYTAVLGVLVVLMPALFRPWLGRNASLLAATFLLISPVTLYYHRYIRHDTPSIFFALLLIYAVLMYLNGPAGARRRLHWLLLVSIALIGNLGSKETAFIYIAIVGSFLFLYWLVRLAQTRRQVPGRRVFSLLLVALLAGSLAALGLVVLLTIVPLQTALAAAAQSGWWQAIEARTLLVGLALLAGALFAGLLWPLVRHGGRRALTRNRRDLLVIVALALVVCGGLMLVESLSHSTPQLRAEVANPLVPEEPETETSAVNGQLPLILAWLLALIVLLLLLAGRRQGWWSSLRRYPELDLIIVIGTLILPWVAPLLITLTGARATDYSPEGITRAALALLPLAAISIGLGLSWNWRRWLPCALLFYAVFAFFFTTMFTNLNGLATGLVGSLGYWIEQQGVRRGSQPQYYYVGLLLPVYEFLPVLGSALAMAAGPGIFWRRHCREPESLQPAAAGKAATTGPTDSLRGLPFLWLLAWWAVLSLFGYTIAGEKMPWLTTHLTLPLILLAAWYFGRILDGLDVERLKRGGWLALVLFSLLAVTLFQVLQPLWGVGEVFGGLAQEQLARSGRWLGVVAISGMVLVGLYRLGQRHGRRHLRQLFALSVLILLALVTARTALRASFVNHDLATEYLVYAHAAPAVKTVLRQLEETSMRVTDGRSLAFAYDDLVSWPYSWYFRNFSNARYVGNNPSQQAINEVEALVVGAGNLGVFEPLLGQRFHRYDFIRMWWPMQEYFGLDAARLARLLDFSGASHDAAALRQAVFDIWWARDYSAWGALAGRNYSLEQWPVADRMSLFVRKDIAGRIRDLRAGDGDSDTDPVALPGALCNENWQDLQAHSIIGSQGSQPGQLLRPIGLALAPDGRLAVAEEGNNRVSLFAPDGEFLDSLPRPGAGVALERPGALRFAANGDLYIADTWNYRIQVLAADGTGLRAWGEAALFGLGAGQEPLDGLWGPRDLVLTSDGQVYVADTGNKRIRVYATDGTWQRDVGRGGDGPGELDEPSGLALHPDGRLFVADTWNRRIVVFGDDGSFQQQFLLDAWYGDRGNRPYLALDVPRELLYVGDPDSGRVLVLDTTGNCQGSFGAAAGDNPVGSRIGVVGGIVVDAQGDVWLADSGSGRILGFPAFPLSLAEQQDGGG